MSKTRSDLSVTVGTVLEEGKIIRQGVSRLGGDKKEGWYTPVQYKDGTYGIVVGTGKNIYSIFTSGRVGELIRNSSEMPRITGFECDIRDYIHLLVMVAKNTDGGKKRIEYPVWVTREINLPMDAMPGDCLGTITVISGKKRKIEKIFLD